MCLGNNNDAQQSRVGGKFTSNKVNCKSLEGDNTSFVSNNYNYKTCVKENNKTGELRQIHG